LISDKTVWTDLAQHRVGWAVPIETQAPYIEKLRRCIAMDNDEFYEMSSRARRYANEWLAGDTSGIAANEKVLQSALAFRGRQAARTQ
ncbi:MAG: hypothetical protein JO314_00050, partial [Acidobacteria bacterium]|nr:hypothetical protein [Acidobacteriota bacterium]